MTVSEEQARHLEECLSSVRAQARVRPEVVLVPWGSWRSTPPDDSLPIEESLASARRAGVALTRAPYVRFIEATDTTPAQATAGLLTRLQRSAAPTAAGVSERIDATWRDRAHQVAPEVALDLGARLFQVGDEVLDALDFEPVHGRWADAMLAGLDVATIPDVVHHDHHREHGLPFGHLPRRADEVLALAAVVEDTTRKLAEELTPAWAAGLLDRRLPSLVEDVESFEGEVWDALRRTTQELLDLADPAAVRVEARLQARLVAEDRRDDLTALVLRRWREPDDFATTVTPEGVVLADLGVDAPLEVLTVHERETPLWATVRHAHDGVIDLVVLARGVPSTPHDRVNLHAAGHGVRGGAER